MLRVHLVACFRWWCGEGNETQVAWVLKFGSKCVIHTAFFAKRTEITIDASITTYHRREKALLVMPRRREGAIGAVNSRPRRPAETAKKTTAARQCAHGQRHAHTHTHIHVPGNVLHHRL